MERLMPIAVKRPLAKRRLWGRVRPPRGRYFGSTKPFFFVRALRRGAQPTRLGELRMVAGRLEVRLAKTDAEIAAAQRLRYEVFYEELSAKASQEVSAERRDFDRFDPFCDHLIVLDHTSAPARVVGVYRLLRRDMAARVGQFYTQDEFNIRKLLRGGRQVLELGRSCVHPEFRNAGVMNLMWRALAHYIVMHDVKILFGCASFPGADPEKHSLALSYLHNSHLAPNQIRPRALRKRYINMNGIRADLIDEKEAQLALPPLLRGYLRLGGVIGDGAVIDEQFDTLDVCIVVRTDQLAEDYARRYQRMRDRTGVDAVGSPLGA